MFKISRTDPFPATLDLKTIADTLAYIHDDVKRVPGLEKVASALATSLDEIKSAERASPRTVIGKSALSPAAITARFFPRRG